MKIKAIYDNGGETFDRYTVVYDYVEGFHTSGILYTSVGMSKNPFHPQGFAQHDTVVLGKHLGKRIKFAALPKDCQKLVK